MTMLDKGKALMQPMNSTPTLKRATRAERRLPSEEKVSNAVDDCQEPVQ